MGKREEGKIGKRREEQARKKKGKANSSRMESESYGYGRRARIHPVILD